MKATVRSLASRPKSGMNVRSRATDGASRQTASSSRPSIAGGVPVLSGLKKASPQTDAGARAAKSAAPASAPIVR